MSVNFPTPPVVGYDPQNESQFRRQIESELAILSNKISDLPVITSITATFLSDGSAKVTVTGNKYVKSIKCAASTSAYPSTATVEAATPTDGHSADFTFAGPYAMGNTVYLSAMGYTGGSGSGLASVKCDVKVVVSVIQSTLLVTITQTASTGFSDPGAGVLPTVTLQVTVTDPAGLLTGNALVTIAYNGISALYNNTLGAPATTGNWTIGTTYTLTATLYKALGGGGFAKFTATKSGGYSGYTTWWASSAWADMPADLVITIGSNQSSSDVTAKASLVVNTVENADSMKWYASTSSQPSKATTIASGTSVSVGPPFYVADLGVTLALGDTVYVTVVLYDYTGTLMDKSFEVKATRANLSRTKTVQWTAAGWFHPVPNGGFYSYGDLWVNYNIERTYDELWVRCNRGLTSGAPHYSRQEASMTFVLADGGTVTGIQAEVWGGADGTYPGDFVDVNVKLYAVSVGSSTDSASPVATVSDSATGAWETTSVASCSQTTTSKRFTAVCEFYVERNNSGSDFYGKFRSFKMTYLPSDLQATV